MHGGAARTPGWTAARNCAALAVVVAAFALAGVASARPLEVAHGRAGSFPWKLSVTTIHTGPALGLCDDFEWAWGPGQPIGNGGEHCVIASTVSRSTRRWVFDIDLRPYDGLGLVTQTGTGGIRGVIALADPRAQSVKVWLRDGEVLRARAHRLPAALHRPAAIAWMITGHARSSVAAKTVTRGRAYDRRGHLVGRFH